MPDVYILVYRPIYGNYLHWSLYVEGQPPRIFEVAGEHPDFQPNVIEEKPEYTRRHVESIMVGEVNGRDMPEFDKIMGAVNIDNETVEWNCQDYVLEALEALTTEFVIDEEDGAYKKGVRKAKKEYYGPQ